MDLLNILTHILMSLTTWQRIAVMAVPMLLAITVHEAAHGYVARHFGDMTAARLGRISLNPLKHIDPIGTLLIPCITMLSGFFFGWAKPVPVDFMKLRHPKRDMLWVAAAGPASNLVMAILWGLVMNYAFALNPKAALPLALMGAAGIFTNVGLMVLNLIPLPPLDGGRIAVSLLPPNLSNKFAQIERFGFVIIIALAFTGVLGKAISPLIDFLSQLISRIFMY